MALLAGTCYDPAVAVTKATSALLAMTALDTTNLRLSFTVPASGSVMVRLAGCISGGTTPPLVLLGVLESSTVKGRAVAMGALRGTALATTHMPVEAVFIVSGLTPSASLTWDAAYGVETVATSSAIKYGGPNDATTSDNAWGGFCFEVWST